jgi:hypothetical protein
MWPNPAAEIFSNLRRVANSTAIDIVTSRI